MGFRLAAVIACTLLPPALTAPPPSSTFNASAFNRLPHAKKMLAESWCLWTKPSACAAGASLERPTPMLTGLAKQYAATVLADEKNNILPSAASSTCAATFCCASPPHLPVFCASPV